MDKTEIEKLKKALESANYMCRSAMQIAKRQGRETDWHNFMNRLKESLKLQHEIMYPDNQSLNSDSEGYRSLA